MNRFSYYRRILASYLLTGTNQLTFWHERPAVNLAAFRPGSDVYYMIFHHKADYTGPLDESGIPLLDYHGVLGRHYNPIAIAHYGMGNFNRWRDTGADHRRRKFIRIGDWLVDATWPGGSARRWSICPEE